MIYSIIMAGGVGARMGNVDRPKQFLNLAGRPVIIHTIEKFVIHSEFEKVLVLCPHAWVGYTEDLIKKYIQNPEKVVVLQGGATGNETIMNAIRYIDEQGDLNDETRIVAHDAVRPFVTHRIIQDNIEAVKQYDAVDTVIPATDTIVESDDGKVLSQIPDRKKMYQGQMPQSFRAKLLWDAYYSLGEAEKSILTDACKIMVLKGQKVHLVLGEASNMKITHPVDMRFAEALTGRYDAE